MAKTNRNAWSSSEDETLLENVSKSSNKTQGCKKAAKKLGRTAGACYQRYVVLQRKSDIKPEKNEYPSVQFHNGISKKAEVILKKEKLLVAKCDNIVITVELE